MSRRKDELRALLIGGGAAEPKPEGAEAGAPNEAPKPAASAASAASPSPAPPSPPERTTSGAVKAMGLALGHLRSGAEDARSLRETLAKGERVVEIDPDHIEPAFVSDRLSRAGEGDESFEALKVSIAEGGQEVPVLVRPHPDAKKAAQGRYQAAYGHRRIAATRALGLKVRAVVRALSDEELVVAQGKENSERRDLSFVERAFFCRALLERGFERKVAQAALSLHKAEMTRLLQVAEAIPLGIAQAIGPAPKAGRTRWMELAEHLKTDGGRAKAEKETEAEEFRAASSDERFAILLARLAKRSTRARRAPEELVDAYGVHVASLRRSAKATTIEIAEKDFADFVADELIGLHAVYASSRRGRAARKT